MRSSPARQADQEAFVAWASERPRLAGDGDGYHVTAHRLARLIGKARRNGKHVGVVVDGVLL